MKEFLVVFSVLLTTNVGWLFKAFGETPVYYLNFIVLPLLLLRLAMTRQLVLNKDDLWLLACLPLAVVGVAKTFLFDGQPLLSGIKAAKFDFFILFYLYFRYCKLDFGKVVRAILLFGFLLSLVIIFASVSENSYLYEISYMNIEQRFGMSRYILGIPLIVYCIFFYFQRYMVYSRAMDLALVGYFLAIVFLIMQTRTLFVALIPVLFFAYVRFFKYKMFFNVYFILVFTTMLGLQIMQDKSMIKQYVEMSQSERKSSTSDINSYSARISSHTHFFLDTMQHPVIGRGKFWSDSPKFEERDRLGYLVQSTDVGLANVFYRFGILGVIWALVLFYTVLFKYRKIGNDIYLNSFYLFFLFVVISGVTLDHLTDDKNTIFTFMLLALFLRRYWVLNCKKDEGATDAMPRDGRSFCLWT